MSSFLPLTQTAKLCLIDITDDRCKYVYEEEKKRDTVRYVSEKYHLKYRKCLHFEYENQEIFIKTVMNGIQYCSNMDHLQMKFCSDCTMRLFAASNRLTYFKNKIRSIMTKSNFDIKKIKSNDKFLTFGISLLLLLQNPLILKNIIRSLGPDILIKHIFQIVYEYYLKWTHILNQKQPHTNRHKHVSDKTLSAIDHMTQLTLRSLIYLLPQSALLLLVDVHQGRFFKTYILDIWESTPIENNTLVWVSQMWWKKLYRNKKYFMERFFMNAVYDFHYDAKTKHTTITKKKTWEALKVYPYLQELYAFVTKNPRKLLGVVDYCTNHYKSAYMKMHEYDTICGNRNCQIGYFEHRYGDMYFDGTETIMNFILV
eukprot:332806_1